MFRQSKVSDYESALSWARGHGVRTVSVEVSPKNVYRLRGNLVTRRIVGETIIVPISGDLANLQKVFSLNETGAFVWGRLDGRTSLDAICDALSHEFEVEESDAWEDVKALVEDLAEADLVEKVD